MVLSEEYLHKIILQEVNQNVAFTIDRYHVESAFNRLNKICFNGRLKPCSINLKLPKNYLGFFKYDGYTNNNQLINPTISINGQYQYTTIQFESVLVHEMIHYWLAMIGADPKCTHGIEFKQMASQINSQCNLNIDERVDTGGMTYNNNYNAYKPSQQIIGKLRGYHQALQQYTSQMKNDIGNKSGNIGMFIQTLYSFNVALINAIDRCVKKNSLNESDDFSSDIAAFKNGYNQWSNDFLDFLKNWNGIRNTSNKGKASSYNNNATLMRLLFTTFPYEIEKKFDAVNKTTMNALSSIGYVDATMQTIRQMGQEVETEMQNAQGANP
jgi:hypothetical protein